MSIKDNIVGLFKFNTKCFMTGSKADGGAITWGNKNKNI